MSPLLDCFGTGEEMIALAYRGATPVAAALLSRGGTARVATFQPSQLPLGPWLVSPGEDASALAAGLLRHLQAPTLMLALTQLDPRWHARPEPTPALETLDYIDTAWIDVAGSYDAYWEARGKNLRTNMRKQRSKLQAEGVTAAFDTLTDAADMAAAVTEYGRLEGAGWKAERGTAVEASDAQGRFYRSMLEQFCAVGRGRVWRLRFDDKVVAMDLCIEGGGTLVVLKTAFDPEYRSVSPAFLMKQDAFRDVFDEGRIKRIEFYGRLMEWHTRWTAQSRTLYHANVYRWAMVARLRERWHRVVTRTRRAVEPSPAPTA
ncbi:MAG TPA: GNAT family N-acetyltransferase [Caldimonas sp.]|nr:GNAT family N-acetyltransferase [Caldimonas sp.]